MTKVFAIEVDYDGEQVSIDQALEAIVQETGVLAKRSNVSRSLDRLIKHAKRIGLEARSGGRAGRDGERFRVVLRCDSPESQKDLE